MSNIATNIEQSKHLLELGLSKETADMSYSEDYFGKDKDGNDEWRWKLNACKFVDVEGIIPAWSLSALLEVMPKFIVHNTNKHVLCLKYAEGVAPFIYYVVESGRNKGKLIRFDNGRCVPDAYDALDAAYEMVCWLLEQGLIKKGGKQ